MTGNQIAYWNLQETKRSNQVKEKETERSNKAKETETNRTNLVNEKIKQDTLSETNRSNLVQEAETARKNTADIEQKRLDSKLKAFDYGTKAVTSLVDAIIPG